MIGALVLASTMITFQTGQPSIESRLQNSLFALVKVSYNSQKDPNGHFNVLGAAFFVDKKTAVTAWHAIKPEKRKPEKGFKHCDLWLLSRHLGVPISKGKIESHSSHDVGLIRFKVDREATPLTLMTRETTTGEMAYCAGYPLGPATNVAAEWHEGKVYPVQYDINAMISEAYVKSSNRFTSAPKGWDGPPLDSTAYVLEGISGPGMSGGPVISKEFGDVLGMIQGGPVRPLGVSGDIRAITADMIRKALKSKPDPE